MDTQTEHAGQPDEHETVDEFIPRFLTWCERHGIAPGTATGRILGRSNGIPMLRKREQRNREDMRRLSLHMQIADAQLAERE